MWDLTVPGNDDHDFYIDTAATTVLVHNTACSTFGRLSPNGRMDIPNKPGVYKITVDDGNAGEESYIGKASDIHERIHGAFRPGAALYDAGYRSSDVKALDWIEMDVPTGPGQVLMPSDSELFDAEAQWMDYEGGPANLANRINSPGNPGIP
jgi:hypothetical protein